MEAEAAVKAAIGGYRAMKELFRDLLVEIKALKKAPMMLKAQIAQKAVVRAAQTMESMIEEIDILKARVAELEGGNSGKS